MSRRSARIQARPQRTAVYYDAIQPDTDGDVDSSREQSVSTSSYAASSPSPEPDEQSLTKRSKSGVAVGRAIRGKRGSLHAVIDMPLDILFEIFSYLLPMDLLNLARTTKDLRAFILQRSSASFWKATFQNPQCHNCQARNCHNIFWECRLRLCKRCANSMSVAQDTDTVSRHGQYCSVYYEKVLPVLGYERGLLDVGVFYRPQLESFKLDISKMKIKHLRKLLEQKREEMDTIRATVIDLENWYENARQAHFEDLIDLREQRKEAIRQKLTELGWKPELDFINGYLYSGPGLDSLPGVRKAQALTPRIWNNIEGHLLDFLAPIRERRLKIVKRQQAEHRLEELAVVLQKSLNPSFHTYHLSFTEVATLIPQVRQLLEPHADEFDREALKEVVLRVVPKYAQERMKTARKYFGDLIRADIELDPATDPLSLAVAWRFTCEHCHLKAEFPSLLSHRCRFQSRALLGPPAYFMLVNDVFRRQSLWSREGFRTNVREIEGIIRVAGFDPSTTSVQDLDDAQTYFRCTTHRTGRDGEACIHTWRSALLHQQAVMDEVNEFFYSDSEDSSSEAAECEIVQITDEHIITSAAPLFAARKADVKTYERDGEWTCAICQVGTYPMARKEVLDHLKSKHDITEPSEADVIPPQDTWMSRSVFLIPRSDDETTSLRWPLQIELQKGSAAIVDFSIDF